MVVTTLGMELVPKLQKLLVVLNKYDPTTRQQLLELLTARHAMEYETNVNIPMIAEENAKAVHKHVLQIIKQWKETESG
jgi:GTPase involved in cell partitioning and DNA repair